MIKKTILSGLFASMSFTTLFAGGILTNTNQSARFSRLICLDASTTIDAAYSNPAGLVMLREGFHFALSNQSAYQTRSIEATFEPFTAGPYASATHKFKGEASAPIIPSIQAAYKKGAWTISANIAVSGGGGKATFNKGLPMFEAPIAAFTKGVAAINPAITSYKVDQYMQGSSFIYGVQIGGTYEVSKQFALYGGFRLNIVNNGYEGHLRNLRLKAVDGSLVNPYDMLGSVELLQKATTENGANLSNKQSGWGISPIIGINFNKDKLNIGMKYEFRTRLNVENKTKIDDTGMFLDGVNTPHDIPALFTVGVSYQLLKPLMVTAGYHHFFDSEAKMQDDKQNYISGGTDEYLFGAELQLNKTFLISAGTQITRYGVKDEYQSDLNFSLNSYSIGFGGAAKVTDKIKINIGYFWTTYSNQTIAQEKYKGTGHPGSDVYSRTNKVFAAGVDFSF